MFHDYNPTRVAGPFGYTARDLSSRTPEEREAMRRELDALDNKLQWGYEPGRWAKGAAWHDDDWPEPKLLQQGALASAYGRRDDLIAEAGDFRATLDGADKVWKAEAGRNSPFLPAIAERPREERAQMRQRGKALRDLVAFGETPDRWRSGIGFLSEGGHLLNPQADTERLLALHAQRNDLLPALDTMDHALDYLDEVDAETSAESVDAPTDGNDSGRYTLLPEPVPSDRRGDGTDGIPGEVAGVEPLISDYPPEDRAVPLPHVYRPKKPLPPAAPSNPWSRFADGWRRRWANLGPGFPAPEAEGPDTRPWWNNPVQPVDMVELLSNTETGVSSAPAQPTSGSTGGSPTGGPVTVTGPGNANAASPTPPLNSQSPTPTPNANAPSPSGGVNTQEGVPYRGSPGDGQDPTAEPKDFPDSVKEQGSRPIHQAGAFIRGTNLINSTMEQSRLGMIADGAPPHIFARPNRRDRFQNDPSHPDNIFADASPEARAAIQQAKLAQARIEAGKWIAHRKGLAAIPDIPGFTDDPQGYVAGKVAGLPGQAVDATPGLGQIAGSDDVFGQTLKQLGIDTNDPDKIAAATQDPAFQNALRGNLDRYWLGAAGDAALDGGKSIFTGNATRWGRKKVLPKLVR